MLGGGAVEKSGPSQGQNVLLSVFCSIDGLILNVLGRPPLSVLIRNDSVEQKWEMFSSKQLKMKASHPFHYMLSSRP